ncbi:glycosyl hydrolase family 95 catalytic domain-containing protein [Microbacterium aurantiacum]|uniref:Glycoside hydrolase family 95 protein n=1 Tax=Microbacterium aurantiacum TaxID=162393 RepID=A0ABT8FUV5_9MICO|nr:glycoside hydrolase N-terminal domain-containing protein [Microbacterium aurantiacum]MDN4465005.1 glycoside hydrolase family 95 protein [Microbacterium aurantiacum]
MTTLRYKTASESWLDRLPLGNGRVGVMVGADAARRRLGLNEAGAWSGGLGSARRELIDPDVAAQALAAARDALARDDPHDAEDHLRALQRGYAQAFLPVGEVSVVSSSQPVDEHAVVRELDLDAGVHVCRREGLTATSIVSWESGLVVHREVYDDATDLAVSFTTSLRVADRTTSTGRLMLRLDLPSDVAPTHEPGSPAVTWDSPHVRPGSVLVVADIDHDGVETLESLDGGLAITGAHRVEIRVAVATTTGLGAEPQPVGEIAALAERSLADARGGDEIARHARSFRRDAPVFALELGDGEAAVEDPHRRATEAAFSSMLDGDLLAALVAYGVYLLRCSSAETTPPANLQGIWNAQMQPPWSSAYTLNINAPMNYWAAEQVGLSGPHRALLNLLEVLARTGRDTAGRLYGLDGWVAHHNTDIWGYTFPTAGDAAWSQWPLGGAWLVRQFDEQRRHGAMPPEVRERFWPVARECARFLLGWLHVDETGAATTSPSTSPENRYIAADGRPAALTIGSAFDLALIREVLSLVIDLASECGDAENPVATAAKEMLPRLAFAGVTSDGRVQEWGRDVDDEDRQHRHLSHLYEWFPGDGGPSMLDTAASYTLDTRGDDSTGWSLAWKIALRARLRDGVAVSRLLRLAMRPASSGDGHRGGLYPNLFAAHPPFQIDGNFGLVAGVLECLVQSHRPGTIDILPALPPDLPTGRLRGFIARPGIRLDLDWRDGTPTRLRLEATHPGAVGPISIVQGEGSASAIVPDSGWIDVRFPLSSHPPHSSTGAVK